MLKKTFNKLFIFLIICVPISGFAEATIYQTGTLLNLMHGIYTGSTFTQANLEPVQSQAIARIESQQGKT